MDEISIGKFQVYYNRLRENILKIREKNGYMNLSKAFAYWYLNKHCNLDNQAVEEAIIDSNGDNGIDAILINDKQMSLYQFKFPDKVSNIDKYINETTILKLVNGYKKLISNRKPKKANEQFNSYRTMVKEHNIFDCEFIFVSYSEGFSEPAKDALANFTDEIKRQTGNIIKIKIINKKSICDIMDKSQKRDSVNISLKYVRLDPSFNLNGEGNSWVGFTNAKTLLNACSNVMDTLFDENIRLYESNSPVNDGIKKTASGNDSKYFYFFHNGIVFICDNCSNSTGNSTVTLNAASVVNGCQTIVSLKDLMDLGTLKDDVFLPFRIIETNDFDLRAKITEYLNTQSKIKDSYFLANNTFIKELQSELLKKGYFLERLANEYSFKLALKKIHEYPKDKVLNLEKTIQIFIAYYNNRYASTAKRGKSELFNPELIGTLITPISAEKVLLAYHYYKHISKVITLYRRCRRSKTIRSDFLDFLECSFKDESDYEGKMDEYIFMHTADLLLLNAFSNLKSNDKYKKCSDNVVIRKAIFTCKDIIKRYPKMNPSSATKNVSVFDQVQKKCQE